MGRLLRLLAEKRRLDRSLRIRRIARAERAAAARRGIHSEITRRAAQARAMFTN